MITEEAKQKFIEKTVQAIKNSSGQMFYSEKDAVHNGTLSWSEEQLVIFCLAEETITRNIPVWPNGVRTLREYSACWRISETFRLTNADENHFISISHHVGFNHYRIFGTFDLGRLEFRDDTHMIYKSGSGSKFCDFIDIDHGYLIEAKYNYFKGSPSGLHDAKYLLDYNDTDAALYAVCNGKVLITDKPLALYTGIITPRKPILEIPGINTELMDIIKNGIWIPEIEQRLVEEGFQWNF